MQKRRLDCTALVGVLTAFSTVILIVQRSQRWILGKPLSREQQPRAIEEVTITCRSEGTMGNRDTGIQRVMCKEPAAQS